YYVNKVMESNTELKEYEGELRGGRYSHLLSGVFSARMWIKQRNTAIEYLYEKYTEPVSTITWALDKYGSFIYPNEYILQGIKWLQKNAPHDSICGCSIDQVHNEMIVRFDWAEQIANEVYKNSFLYLADLININIENKETEVLVVYNPLPWKRKDIVSFNTISRKIRGDAFLYNIKIIDSNGQNIEYQYHLVEEESRYQREQGISHQFTFLAEVPACGYKTYFLIPIESTDKVETEDVKFKITRDFLENDFYRIEINTDGLISVIDKETGLIYENVCDFEDVGDWGDEYDFSGPKENQTDLVFNSGDAVVFERSIYIDGPTEKTFKLRLNLKLPHSLTEDRYNRKDWLVDNKITVYISLYKGIKRVDFRIELENNSKDHRIRVLFPTKIKAEKVYADGHFYVVPRSVKLPKADNWVQKPLPTNHQKDFISVSSNSRTFAVFNKGLPEYEAIVNEDKTITIAITLLRSIEWLSRDDFRTRMSHAGPGYRTPDAQCQGKYVFELSFITESKSSWLDSNVHQRGREFNNPIKAFFPAMVKSPLRVANKVVLKPSGIVSAFSASKERRIDSFLPPVLSFLEIDNTNIVLSALKKSEEGNNIIVRVYNISSELQKVKLTFYEKISIKRVEIVNLLEETPKNVIKAQIHNYNYNYVEIELKSHVIATFKIKHELIEG
ncbi:MAG: glycoside hydrolase family 38 C-terminal domain-containing protein, partial [Candidatus Hermodarchaeota archaeon]